MTETEGEFSIEDLDIKAFLIEQMVKVATGKLTPVQAEAVASIAQQVYNFTKHELELEDRVAS